jgi:hypothetical protein
MIQPKNWFDDLGEWSTKVLEGAMRLLVTLIVIAAYGLFFWFAYIVLKSILGYIHF